MPGQRLALLVATYQYQDAGLRQLTAPSHDAEALAAALRDPQIAGFDVTILINEPHHKVGDAIGEFYYNRRRDDLTLLYFTGHGLKDDAGRLYLAMTDTKRDRLLFSALSAQQIDEAMELCPSRQKVLMLDCCYSGAFPAGRLSKADGQVHALEKFQGKGRVVLTASDATQYSFEGSNITGEGIQSVFTRFLVEGLVTGEADLDSDGDISLDELYSYVYERVVEEIPQQRPKKQENVEGRIVIARNIHWRLPAYIRNAILSPFAQDRLAALDGLTHLLLVGNDLVRAEVINHTRRLVHDNNRMVSVAAMKLITTFSPELARREAEEQARREATKPLWVPAVSSSSRYDWTEEEDKGQQVTTSPTSSLVDSPIWKSDQREVEAQRHTQAGATTEEQRPQQTWREAGGRTNRWTAPSWWFALVRWYEKQARREDNEQGETETQISEHLGLFDSWGLGWLTRRQTTLATVTTLVILLISVLVIVSIRSGTTVIIPVGSRPARIAVTPDGLHAYVTNTGSGNVSVINTATNTVTTTIPVGINPWGIAVTSDGHRAYVANTSSNSVSVIDTIRNTVISTIRVGIGPWGVAVAPDGRHIYVTKNSADNVSVIDAATNAVTATITVSAVPSGVAVAPDGHRTYVTNYLPSSGNASVIDTATNTVTATISVGTGTWGVAVTPDGHRVYVTNTGSDRVSVIDTAANTVTATISVGTGPRGVAVTSDGRRAYVTNLGSNSISVIDTATNTVTETISGTGTGEVTVTPDGHHAYVTNPNSNKVSVINI